MKRVLIGSVALLVVLITMPALAKGVIGVTIEGPGIDEAIHLSSDGTTESADRFFHFVEATGFPEMVWGAAVTGESRILTVPPDAELGPEYLLTWIEMGPEGDIEVEALLYPLASGGPLVYLEPDFEVPAISAAARGTS